MAAKRIPQLFTSTLERRQYLEILVSAQEGNKVLRGCTLVYSL
jgi:hypothetical protein